MATRDPSALIAAIHEAEEVDAAGARWPRSKRHDDKALVVVEFPAAPRQCRVDVVAYVE